MKLVLLILSLLPFALALLWQSADGINGRHWFVNDDVYVSFRYALNFAHGDGLVWNKGEYVQGITNLGWTLLFAIQAYLGLPVRFYALSALLINACLHATATLVILDTLLNRWKCHRITSFLASAIAALAYYGILKSGTEGFETVLLGLLFLLVGVPFVTFLVSTTDASRAVPLPSVISQRVAFFAAALSIFVRLDASVFLAGCIAPVLLFKWGSKNLILIAFAKRLLAVSLLSMLLVLMFQYVYYDSALPNTYYLKVPNQSGKLTRGVQTTIEALVFHGFGPLMVCALYALKLETPSFKEFPTVAIFPLLFVVGYSISIGGDFFHFQRFIAVAAYFSAALLGLLWTSSKQTKAILASVVLQFAPWLYSGYALKIGEQKLKFKAASALSTLPFVEEGSVAIAQAGMIPFYNDRIKFVDVLGKMDRKVAAEDSREHFPIGHSKWNLQHSLGSARFIIRQRQLSVYDCTAQNPLQELPVQQQIEFTIECYLQSTNLVREQITLSESKDGIKSLWQIEILKEPSS